MVGSGSISIDELVYTLNKQPAGVETNIDKLAALELIAMDDDEVILSRQLVDS